MIVPEEGGTVKVSGLPEENLHESDITSETSLIIKKSTGVQPSKST